MNKPVEFAAKVLVLALGGLIMVQIRSMPESVDLRLLFAFFIGMATGSVTYAIGETARLLREIREDRE